jgi:hypothetical protein
MVVEQLGADLYSQVLSIVEKHLSTATTYAPHVHDWVSKAHGAESKEAKKAEELVAALEAATRALKEIPSHISINARANKSQAT